MIISRWRPSVGGYDHFESSTEVPMANDMPTPQLPRPIAGIGVPSVQCGRPWRAETKVGSGPLPQGVVAPLSGATGLSGITDAPWNLYAVGVAVLVLAAAMLYAHHDRSID